MTTTEKLAEREALKPCPFCGGEARRSVVKDEDIWTHNTVPWTRIVCSDCECQTESICQGMEPTAEERWNARAALAATPAPAEPLAYVARESLRWLTDPARTKHAHIGTDLYKTAPGDGWVGIYTVSPQPAPEAGKGKESSNGD